MYSANETQLLCAGTNDGKDFSSARVRIEGGLGVLTSSQRHLPESTALPPHVRRLLSCSVSASQSLDISGSRARKMRRQCCRQLRCHPPGSPCVTCLPIRQETTRCRFLVGIDYSSGKTILNQINSSSPAQRRTDRSPTSMVLTSEWRCWIQCAVAKKF